MKYKIEIKVTCEDVPAMEDIPETMTIIAEADDKVDAIKGALEAAASSWSEVKKEFEKQRLVEGDSLDIDL